MRARVYSAHVPHSPTDWYPQPAYAICWRHKILQLHMTNLSASLIFSPNVFISHYGNMFTAHALFLQYVCALENA